METVKPPEHLRFRVADEFDVVPIQAPVKVVSMIIRNTDLSGSVYVSFDGGKGYWTMSPESTLTVNAPEGMAILINPDTFKMKGEYSGIQVEVLYMEV